MQPMTEAPKVVMDKLLQECRYLMRLQESSPTLANMIAGCVCKTARVTLAWHDWSYIYYTVQGGSNSLQMPTWIGSRISCWTVRSVVSQIIPFYRLQFTASRQLIIPPTKLSTYGHRAFAISGPVIWNSLPDHLKDLRVLHSHSMWTLCNSAHVQMCYQETRCVLWYFVVIPRRSPVGEAGI